MAEELFRARVAPEAMVLPSAQVGARMFRLLSIFKLGVAAGPGGGIADFFGPGGRGAGDSRIGFDFFLPTGSQHKTAPFLGLPGSVSFGCYRTLNVPTS